MPPARCAFLSSSLANVSNMPYVVSLSLNAYQVTVPSSRAAVSRTAVSWAEARKAARAFPLAGGCHKLGREAVPELHVSSFPCSAG
jgi:hypothetical protein